MALAVPLSWAASQARRVSAFYVSLHSTAMPPSKEIGTCKCDWLEHAADDPKCPVEFDAELNEYHLVRGPKDYLLIYYCPFCGGSPPKSRRGRLFHALTDTERQRLVMLTKESRTSSSQSDWLLRSLSERASRRRRRVTR
jgi:hypothetical protein